MDTGNDDFLTLLEGDAVVQLQTLETGSVQCVVTSPPYDALRTYGGFTWDFEAVAKELHRVMCDGGIVCWNVGDSVVDGSETLTSAKQKIFFREQCGFRIHDTMIYERPGVTFPDPTRYYAMFEYIFVLSKGRPRTFNPIHDRKNIWAGKTSFGARTERQFNGELTLKNGYDHFSPEFGRRSNIWKGKTSAQENPCQANNHPAMMPEWLAHDLVLSWSNVGDTILDPFGGSGTTGRVALELGRKAILIELNPDYCKLIEKRCTVTLGLSLGA